MNPIKKGNLLVIMVIALLAFGLSTVMASINNDDAILEMLNITKSSEGNEMIAVGDGNFTAVIGSQVVIPVKNNTTNNTKNTNTTNHTNNTNITNYTSKSY
ncbi:hypothetical protein ALNOE001_13370 [Candidatus Methanobinarius endosymbioticus]|uniref:Uncharacterized protein n=1 Tax=Candidatus Methanobinarius endosymbioticus TaxID=2006182 RepID=A0A366MBI5_9EURY|nr:hypothetical protein ALNOE001_13370 [Candidatus Methanobinarius endosymbioticus]